MQKHAVISGSMSGGCIQNKNSFFKPVVRPELRVNDAADKYEQEANTAAERVMRMPSTEEQPFFLKAGIGAVAPLQRKCTHCANEERLQKKSANSGEATVNASTVHQTINSSGQSLDGNTRRFMESGFGYDFGNVQIHNDANAHRSAAAINALAYASGFHVVFGAGQYQPETDKGKQLLAHELTHVIQQNRENDSPSIQRMQIGKGTRPEYIDESEGEIQFQYVPEEEADKVNAAIGIVRDIVNDESLADCHAYYKDTCPNHESLKETFDKAVIWKYPERDPELAGAHTFSGTPNIGYTYVGYKQNDAKGLAGILLHEMMHCCGITGPQLHKYADRAKLYCLSKHNKFSVGFGSQHGEVTAMLSYRYFLRQLSLGKLTPTIGADLNLKGDDVFSLMVGGQYRSNLLWGGEEFGGLTFGAEAGLTLGKFREMTEVESKKTGWSAGLVLELKTGAEFAIPDLTRWGEGSEGRQMPFFAEGAYRWVKPLNGAGENAHEFVVRAGFVW